MRFLTPPSLNPSCTGIRNDKGVVVQGEAGPGGKVYGCPSVLFHRPAPLPYDKRAFVIPNHIRKAEGRSGEESPDCKELVKR